MPQLSSLKCSIFSIFTAYPAPQSRITPGLWGASNITNGVCTLQLSSTYFGEFLQCFSLFVPSSPMARQRRTKPSSFLTYRSKWLGHNCFTSETEVFILTLCLHEVQISKPKEGREFVFLPKLGQATVEKYPIISESLFYGHICTILSCN